MKGFRPGKEPPQLRKRRAKAEPGSDASWAQKAAVDAVAGRTPQKVRAMVRRWSLWLTVGGVATAIGGLFLYGWSLAAGVVVHVVSALFFLVAFRVRRSGTALEEMSGRI